MTYDLFNQPSIPAHTSENNQTQIDFAADLTFGGQLYRIYAELKAGKRLTCEDAPRLGVAGSGLARRMKDLRDIYFVPVNIGKRDYVRTFDGKRVKISEYYL